MDKNKGILKNSVINAVRKFFLQKGFIEVPVPLLQESVPLEPNIYPFSVTKIVSGKKKILYRPTSPESVLKKFLHKTPKNCFAVSPTFRDLEPPNPIRSPEFTMVEWYRVGSSMAETMKDVQQLIGFTAGECQSSFLVSQKPWPKTSMEELFWKATKTSLSDLINDTNMKRFADRRGYDTQRVTWEQLFNQAFLNEIELHLGPSAQFITGYPARISPLCKKERDNSRFSKRFELYINGIEIANGNEESSNIKYIKKVFTREQKSRKIKSLPCPPVDTQFLLSLENLEKLRVSGVGLGIERLCMILNRTNTI